MTHTDGLLKVALMHMAPGAGDLAGNRRVIEDAIVTAAAAGADWVITPELAVCGYAFEALIGTGWIPVQPDPWMSVVCNLAARSGIAVFLGAPERDPASNRLYNSMFAIDRTGIVCGRHRKINPLRVGAEAWSTPGTQIRPIAVDGLKVGALICADACSPKVASGLHAQGARLLVSSAAWAPGRYGPAGEWERATADTGLPLFVCNRTGEDAVQDFSRAESVVVHGGRRLIAAASPAPAMLSFTWELARSRSMEGVFDTVELGQTEKRAGGSPHIP